MTPRTDVHWINLDAPETAIKERLMTTPHSRLPVGEGSVDVLIGVVQTRELLAALLVSGVLDVRAHVRQAPIIPETTDALDALATLREAGVPMALVHDEYGLFEGLLTPADVLEAIVGAFRSDEDDADLDAVERDDGSWLLSGAMPVDEMADRIGVVLPERRVFHTVAGLVLAYAQRLPEVGDCIEALGWRFEILDLDGRRIDKVLATRSRGSHRRP